jgi:hypothetical protein
MLAVLTVAVLGGFSNAATPAVSVTGVGTTSPVLRQAGSAWQTTVLVTDTGADTACVQETAVQRFRHDPRQSGQDRPVSPGHARPGVRPAQHSHKQPISQHDRHGC